MTVFDHVFAQLTKSAKRLVIGYPSEGNGKAVGLFYSIEYYEKEMNNQARSDFHRMNARIAYEVLSSSELHEIIGKMVEKSAKVVAYDGYHKSGLEDEDNAQDKNDEVIVKPVRKASVKKSVAKKPASKTAATTAKSRAKASKK